MSGSAAKAGPSWFRRLIAGEKRAKGYGIAADDFDAILRERRELAPIDAARLERLATVVGSLDASLHALASMYPKPLDPPNDDPPADPAAPPDEVDPR